MKDVRIVVVSWNVQDALERCLESLPKACEGLDWDCVVVDNNSADGSAEIVKRFGRQNDRIDLIANKENKGFAYACNQGAAHQNGSRYILLLNPDTESPAGSLAELVKQADAHPEAGIIGPRLIYPDGKYQPSAQRFPSLSDQSLILLKLHHVFSRVKSLRKYFMQDLENRRSQEVDQVMGACFLVRKACWDEMHGLDQRYFIWFEEVDACKQAKENGWKVWYEPSVEIIHYGGEAFAKVFSWRRQGYFNESLRKYMKKWHGTWAWLVVSALSPISMAMAGVLTIFRVKPSTKNIIQRISGQNGSSGQNGILRYAGSWLVGIFVFEIISALAQGHPVWQTLLTVIAGVTVGILAYTRPAAGLAVVLTELMVGGFGYLLGISADVFVRGISLRMAMMAGYFLGGGLNALTHRVWRFWKLKELAVLEVWIFILGMFMGGLVRGLQLDQPAIFEDANAWIFLLYIIPVLDVAHRFGPQLKKNITGAALASLVWLPIKMLLAFYVFTHQLGISDWFYGWIRDTRVGEITDLHNGLYRIFFQSAIYAVLALPFIIAFLIEKKKYYWGFILGGLCALAGFLSLSRSFWLGYIISISLVLVFGLAWSVKPLDKSRLLSVGKTFLVGLAMAFSAVLLIALTWRVPIPHPVSGSIFDMFMSRVSVTDPAAASRWNLLPVLLNKIWNEPILGYGLGSEVIYKSQDPRVLEQHPDGQLVTYEFEWGWLGLWIKFGIFGLIVVGWLMISISWRTWKSNYPWWIRVGVVAGTAGIVVIHFFTPYLDHPLGFAWIFGVEGLLAMRREELEPTH
jgi:GT2 family glycosyltransferase